jgi:hypothetical protein
MLSSFLPCGPYKACTSYLPYGPYQASEKLVFPTPFVPTGLSFPSEYDHENHPESITIKRKDLERCLRTTIEETMCVGGVITTLARKCMTELDKVADDGSI